MKITKNKNTGTERELAENEEELYLKANKKQEEIKILMRKSYYSLINILKKYLDLKEEYYSIIALWIIGTYFHDNFQSFPYLFFNAMRGSGKSRALRLICCLSKNGNVMASPTEAVLFRVQGTLGIDEFEGVAGKDKNAIRELLNGAYKKGIKIFRMKKKKVLGQEELVAEEFEPYRPIVMANIYGMDEVLGDRCLTLILEKSNDAMKTRLIEDFETNEEVNEVKVYLKECSLCSVVMSKNIYRDWNNYIIDRYKTTLTTLHTYNTYTTQTTQQLELFNKISNTGIIGRNLELFLPIFFLGSLISEEIFDGILKSALEITTERKHEEEIESIDVMVYDFISREDSRLEYHSIKDLVNSFRNFSN